MLPSRLAAALSVSLLLVAATRAEDWPQWRGPSRDGVWRETGILETFPREGLMVRWRVPAGNGYSSPVVAQGRIYLHDYHQGKERVFCWEETTGKELWTFAYDCVYDDPDTSLSEGPRATPTVHEGRLYTLGRDGHLFCFDAADGRVLWKRRWAHAV